MRFFGFSMTVIFVSASAGRRQPSPPLTGTPTLTLTQTLPRGAAWLVRRGGVECLGRLSLQDAVRADLCLCVSRGRWVLGKAFAIVAVRIDLCIY